MAEQQRPTAPNAGDLPSRLHEIAQLLRRTHHLGPQAQQALAAMADELGGAFEQTQAPVATTAPLVQSIGQLAEALHHDEERGQLDSARQRLQDLTASVAGRAPNSAAFVGRLLETLANLGI
jgi:hypothetical protein